jgi:hypothetical protein
MMHITKANKFEAYFMSLRAFNAPVSSLSLVSSIETAGLTEVRGQHRDAQVSSPHWTTYNFEVSGTHNYVADGIRVHNRCLEDFVTQQTLDALIAAGIVDEETHFIRKMANGQYIILTKEGERVTEGALEGHLLVKAIEVVSDYVQHVGHAVGSVFDDFGEYAQGALPGLVNRLMNGASVDEALDYYSADIISKMSIDTLARIFGADRISDLPKDPVARALVLQDPKFFETEIGGAVRGALSSALTMHILYGDNYTDAQYAQLFQNASVSFLVRQALQTQDWATQGAGNVQKFWDWTGAEELAPQLTPEAAAGAAAVSLLSDMFDGGIEDVGQALVNAAGAAAANYISKQVVSTLFTSNAGIFAAGGPISLVVGSVISGLISKLFGGLFKPKPPQNSLWMKIRMAL